MIRATVLFALMSLSGCATYMVQMKVSADADGPDYVIMRTNTGERVFDCLSRPDGTHWEPTCVRVKFKASAPDEK